MPISAPQAKVDATKGYGSEVVLHGETFDDAKAKCEEIIRETGETYLHPYDDVEVMAGQGTIGLDILDDMWMLIRSLYQLVEEELFLELLLH